MTNWVADDQWPNPTKTVRGSRLKSDSGTGADDVDGKIPHASKQEGFSLKINRQMKGVRYVD